MHPPLASRFARVSTLASLALSVAFASLAHAQTKPAVFVKFSTAQVAAGATATEATTTTIAAPGNGWDYSAAAPFAGTTWNLILRPNPAINSNSTGTTGTFPLANVTNLALTAPDGTPSGVTFSGSIIIADLEGNTTRTEPNSFSNAADATLGPGGLMGTAWRIYRGGNSTAWRFAGLPANTNYFIYFYSTNGSAFTLDAANVPAGSATKIQASGAAAHNLFTNASGTVALTTPAVPDAAAASGQNTVWGRLHAVTDSLGQLAFSTGRTALNNAQGLSGLQLIPYPTATFTTPPPPTVTATVGGSVTIVGAASGEGTLSYQWLKDGVAIDTIANPSAATPSLTLGNIQESDAATYEFVVTNPGGSISSAGTDLVVTTDAIAPSITSQPAARTAVTGASVSLSVTANGTTPLEFQWEKSANNTDFVALPGANAATLEIPSVTVADAGFYRLVVTNSVGTATSNSAALTVAPVIAAAPSAAIVSAGSPCTISVAAEAGAGSPEPIAYVWRRNGTLVANSSNISGAATATLALEAFSATDSGTYTVTVSNSAGSITSTPVFIGLASSQLLARFPATGSTSVNPDTPLVLHFASPPRLGATGKIAVRNSADDSIVETIDMGALQTVSSSVATYRYQSKNIGGTTGGTYNYMPVVIIGNEARISLKSGTVLAYGASYYVTVEPGAILDSTGASMPSNSDALAWSFTTKAAAPDTVPAKTAFTVAADGSGDFSTLQGALDFIPVNNTTPVLLNIKAGIYDEIVNTGTRHNLTLVGEGAATTIIQSGNSNVLNAGTSGRVSFLAKGNDLTFRDLALVNTTPKGGSQAEAIRSDGQRVVFIGCAFKGYQDTLLLGGTSYFQDCYIEGDTDYIWGGGTAMFKNCELRCLNPAELTQARTPADRFGFIFLNCTVTKPAGATFSYGLGRNSDNSNVAFIDSRMDTHISAAGWSNGFGTVNLRNWEYNSRNLAGTALIDVSQRTHGRQLTADEAVILRDPANVYGLTTDGTPAGAQGGGWVPAFEAVPAPTIVSAPQNVSVALGGSATFAVTASGTAAFTYQWRRNGEPIAGAVSASYTIAATAYADAGSYDCVVTNSAGSTTSAAATLAVLSPVAVWAQSYGLNGAAAGFDTADADGDGVRNLLEYVLGGNPTVADSGLLPSVMMVETDGAKYLVLEYQRAVAAAHIPVVVETSTDLTTWTARTAGVDAFFTTTALLGLGVNVDINTGSSTNYAGIAAAPGDGEVWNSFRPPASGPTSTVTALTDSFGTATDAALTVTSSGTGFSSWSNATNGAPTPVDLMQDYLFGNTYTLRLTNLPAGNYQLYVYAHGDQDSQTSTITLASANGGGSRFTTTAGGATFRDTAASNAEGVAYVKLAATVGANGELQFTAGNYVNGFQLIQLLNPSIENVRVIVPFTGERLFARLRATQ